MFFFLSFKLKVSNFLKDFSRLQKIKTSFCSVSVKDICFLAQVLALSNIVAFKKFRPPIKIQNFLSFFSVLFKNFVYIFLIYLILRFLNLLKTLFYNYC